MMKAGQRLYPDTEVRANGAALRYQGDGNLVLYGRTGARWATDTTGVAAGYLELQPDGNLVAYDANGQPYWATNSRVDRPELLFGPSGLRIVGASTVWQVELPDEPTPPRPALSRLRVEDNRRWFANDAGRFDWREVSAFSLLSRLLVGEHDHVRAWLEDMRAAGVTVARVLLTLDGDYWTRSPLGGRSFRSAPDMAGYWQRLDELAALTAEAGIYLRACFIGAVEPFGGVWHADRRDVWAGDVRSRGEAFAVEAAQRLGAWAHVLGELANEPAQIGLRDSFGDLIALGRKVKAVAPDMLLCAGAPDGGNEGDVTFLTRPFDFADAHFDRLMGVRGFEWVKRTGEMLPVDQPSVYPPRHPRYGQPTGITPMPFVSGEPVNFGEWRQDGRNADVEVSPSVAFAYGAVSRARQYNACFHYDGGLWTTTPQAATRDCLSAWMAGLDAFPMLTGEKWRGHWTPQSYFAQDWPAEDDPRGVEAHVAGGRGPWRVFGCQAAAGDRSDVTSPAVAFPEPDGWQARFTAPGELVARETRGQFQASVYRRRS